MLHYDPQHVSSSTLLILRRTNCITTASGIVTLCKQPYGMQVESGLTVHSLYYDARSEKYQIIKGLFAYPSYLFNTIFRISEITKDRTPTGASWKSNITLRRSDSAQITFET